jgi:hypothetical protein
MNYTVGLLAVKASIIFALSLSLYNLNEEKQKLLTKNNETMERLSTCLLDESQVIYDLTYCRGRINDYNDFMNSHVSCEKSEYKCCKKKVRKK